jgi:uncharacterized protein involved in exopolysaccharide biosynthesis
VFARFKSQRCFGAICFVAALLLLFAGLRSVLRTRFEAVACVQVVPQSRPVAYWGKESPGFMLVEIRDIYSDSSLKRVVELLDHQRAAQGEPRFANGRSGEAQAVARLKRSMELRPVRNTTSMEIRGWGESPEEAVQIANAIAEAHAAHLQLLSPAKLSAQMSHPDRERGFWWLACSLVFVVGGILVLRLPVPSASHYGTAASMP